MNYACYYLDGNLNLVCAFSFCSCIACSTVSLSGATPGSRENTDFPNLCRNDFTAHVETARTAHKSNLLLNQSQTSSGAYVCGRAIRCDLNTVDEVNWVQEPHSQSSLWGQQTDNSCFLYISKESQLCSRMIVCGSASHDTWCDVWST